MVGGKSLLQEQNELAQAMPANDGRNRFLALRQAAVNRQQVGAGTVTASAKAPPPPPVPARSLESPTRTVASRAPPQLACAACGRNYPDAAALQLHHARCRAAQQQHGHGVGRPSVDVPARTLSDAVRQPVVTAARVPSTSSAAPPPPPPPSQPRVAPPPPPAAPASVVIDDAIPLPPIGHREPDFNRVTTDPTIPQPGPAATSLVECAACHRRFAADRIERHRVACEKATGETRQPFDARAARVQKTYAANSAGAPELQRILADDPPSKKPARSSWRQQSAMLQRSLRGARGETTEFGEPVPEDDGRVQCAGCGRKFAPETAERHVPKCVEKARATTQRRT